MGPAKVTLSSLLYTLVVEVLAAAIRNCKDIGGGGGGGGSPAWFI